MEIHSEAGYSEWLVQVGVSQSHLQAHQFARRIFEENGGLTTESMQRYLRLEEEQGADPARLRNLLAAAKYILKYQLENDRNDELELELKSPPLSHGAGHNHEKPPLDLQLDEFEPLVGRAPPPSRATAPVPRVSDSDIGDQNNFYCNCARQPEPTLVTSGLVLVGPMAFVGFLVLRLYAGKSFAVMAQWGGAALLALVALFLLRMKCENCDTTLDSNTLDSGQKKQLVGARVVLVCVLVITGFFAKNKHELWAEENRIASLSSEELEAEWEREDRKIAEDEVGHSMSDSEYEDYLREEEEEEIGELEELLGRPLTQEELEEEGFGDY